jgi:prolyl-tRNA editing enzyme YbaK/EbsC (Cys-tRNA(Pro) deacylase)
MSLAKTAAFALNRKGVEYRLLAHPRTFSTRETAGAAHVPADHVARSVILEGASRPFMVVVHEHLVEVGGEDFRRLLGGRRRARYSHDD